MKEQREADMRMNLREYNREKLIDTCINMQKVIDGHVHQQQSYRDSIAGLTRQNQELQLRNETLEAEAEGAGIDPAVVDGLEAKIERLETRNDKLQERNEKLQELNEKLQEKLFANESTDALNAWADEDDKDDEDED